MRRPKKTAEAFRLLPIFLSLVAGLWSGCQDPGPQTGEASPTAQLPRERIEPVEATTHANPASIEKKGDTSGALDLGTPAFPIDDPSGVALDGFYAALARSDDSGRSQAITRVAHFGDSSIGQDGLPHELRRRFQDRFGDAGGGFVLLHKSSSNYLNRVVETRSNELWKVCYIAYGCRSDGRYGYGGHLFSGARGAVAKFSTTPPGNLGDKALRFELWYQAWPQGGRVELLVDGESAVTLDTRRATKQDLWHTLDVPLGAHSFEVHTRGPGDFRGYGAVLESEGPGVVWDSMSMNGAFTKRLLFFADAHIAGQIAHRNPDLIVLNYGGNDLRRFVNRNVYPDRFREEMMAAIERIRSGKPEASCLVMGVIDHGRSGTYPVEPEHVALLVEIQREVALTQGCAFFDSYEAMGGEGSIRRWRKLRPSLASADLKHLNARGRKRMAGYIYEGLLHGYATYRRRVNDSP